MHGYIGKLNDHQKRRTNLGLTKGKEEQGGDKPGMWGQREHTTTHKGDKQQGPAAGHGELHSVSLIASERRESEE